MYRIRNAELYDMDFVMDLVEQEGWNPGLLDGENFFHADPEGFFIGEVDGERIGCISAVRYGTFGFLGLYIVKEGYRHQGYGIALWNHAVRRLKHCTVGLDGVVEQQENYKKSGFLFAYNNLRFSGVVQAAAPATRHIVPADIGSFSAIAAYDARHFPAQREIFLSHWLGMGNSRTLCYCEDGVLRGYGTIRECVSGYKIGPLFADTDAIAETLFLSLAEFTNGAVISLDIAELNESARAMCERYGMEKSFETARMYIGDAPVLSSGVYGITTFELG
ncbi:GNAT family N-acetyltransferase [Methanorbis rubei]|uniref:N-acetyltransferase domain-containing protein n=1 Tax=Methanorbis rubei TaxID=3028300 RepID=A0AAE4SBD3_9EURY|nr:hypothetical protein [Methanocorpusculaceae archaeon Cs1]